VVIGLDMSGSTAGGIDEVIRAGGFAMAELLSRLGIPFAMYGHSGSRDNPYSYDDKWDLELIHVKNPNEVWDDDAKVRCMSLHGHQCNLDGHTLEFYRRVIQTEHATDKLIMYFTDGAMPYENFDEELAILQKNIQICQRKSIKLVGVGVGNNDPLKYGLDMIRYDRLGDLPKLVDGLAKRLAV